MMVPLRKSRGGQFLTPLGSPEDMDLEEVRAVGLATGRRPGHWAAPSSPPCRAPPHAHIMPCRAHHVAPRPTGPRPPRGAPPHSTSGPAPVGHAPPGSERGPPACPPQLTQDVSRLQRRSLRHSRQLEAPRPYIAARFSVLPSTFQPGDQKQYGGFDNRGLEPGHRYVLFVLAVLQKSEPVSARIRQPRPPGWPQAPGPGPQVQTWTPPHPTPPSSLHSESGDSQEEGV